MSLHSPKIHKKSVSWSQHPPKQWPRCPSQPSQAPKEYRKPNKTMVFPWFFHSFCYPDHMQNWPQNDAKIHPKPLKLAILGSNVTHVSANLALSRHIWSQTWLQLNPSWRQVGMTSPILGQFSCQLRHPGATLDQAIAKEHFWYNFKLILAPFWDHFGTILGPFGEDFKVNVELFLKSILLIISFTYSSVVRLYI